MHVLITGGTGSVGRAVVNRMVGLGHTAKVIGRRPNMDVGQADYAVCDILDYETLRREMEGADGVIHLAAIPHPAGGPGRSIFQANATGTFHVYEAAAELGIGRVVSASSVNAFGYNFGIKSFPLRYFPIDEDHPGLATDAYSFSKQILEDIAEYFWQREGISGASLRLPWVYDLGIESGRRLRDHFLKMRAMAREFLARPMAEKRRTAADVHAAAERVRRSRANETRQWNAELGDRRLLGVASMMTNLWTNVNAEDSAQAFAKALLADYEGSHPLYINDRCNTFDVNSEELLELFFPEVTDRKEPIVGHASVVSTGKARDLIGFEPEFSLEKLWRDQEAE